MAGRYYVAPTGNDANPGTATLPWRSIKIANQRLQPGDTLNLRQGRYNETIQPVNSGTAVAPIVFRSYPSEVAVIHSRPVGVNLSGRSYIIIDGIYFERCNYFVRSYPEGFDHCTIRNCVMNEQTGWCGIEVGAGSSYNQVLDNFINGSGIEGDAIHIGSDDVGEKYGAQYNLIANNECTGTMHGGICCAGDRTQFNIIRNNYVHDIGDVSIATGALTRWVLIEGNRCQNPGGDPDGACGIQIRSDYTIVRRNIVTRDLHSKVDGSGAGIELQSTSERPWVRYNKVYHNVIANFNQGNTTWYGIKLAVYNTEVPFGPNIFKNNIIFNNGTGSQQGFQIGFTRMINALPLEYFDGNLISTGTFGQPVIYFFEYNRQQLSLAAAIAQYPEVFGSHNLDADPHFADKNKLDFQLTSQSPCIDAGVSLTKTVDEGSGTQIQVEDASYFCDGWGIIEGDVIQIGDHEPVQIIAIDYATQIVTINRALQWQAGEGVSFPYCGLAPEIGAHEYCVQKDTSAPRSPQNIKISGSL
ncbi:MAG: right-handed parallel beta-helix repeat-containing protein [candidate division KSB1 bacterium]|nr:right-handed parallel beta-helix repeat-containing protein [candidate division KSB1 bacterium]